MRKENYHNDVYTMFQCYDVKPLIRDVDTHVMIRIMLIFIRSQYVTFLLYEINKSYIIGMFKKSSSVSILLDYAFINFWRIDLSPSIKACHTTTTKEAKWCKDNQNHKKHGHPIAQSAAETEMGTASGWSRNNVIICDWETSWKKNINKWCMI